jgi:hypothetical protein
MLKPTFANSALLELPVYRQLKELKFFAKLSVARAVPCFSDSSTMGF